MNSHSSAPSWQSLTTSAQNHPHVFAAAFNTGDPDAIERVYEGQGIFVKAPGSITRGEARRSANADMVGMGVPITVSPRHVYVADDIALLIVDWEIKGISDSGVEVDVRGTATDVARRGADGLWRYVIDNPFGTATAIES